MSASLVLFVVLVATGCGGRAGGTTAPGTRSASQGPPPLASPAPARAAARVRAIGRLPAPVQLPAVTGHGPTMLALGGLDAADTSTAAVVRLTPGRPRALAPLPVAVHDAGATTIGRDSYVFGGGAASGSLDTIVRVGAGTVGHLPVPASDVEAVTIGRTAYVVGGYDGASPLTTITAWRPGSRARVVARLPHALRYAAVGVEGGDILVAGGTDGTASQRAIYRVDPRSGAVRTIGRLPVPISHLGGAVVDSFFYLVGGRTRGDETRPRRAILAVNTKSGTVRRAGRLPVALSDVGVGLRGSTLLVAGGRDAAGAAAGELLQVTTR